MRDSSACCRSPTTPASSSRSSLRNFALCELALAAGYLLWHKRAALEREVAAHAADSERRLGDERLRIAREVHDVVAHAMVAINVQAGVAAHLLDDDPEQAREALLQIKRTSGEALTDLRATLGVLRDPDRRRRSPAPGSTTSTPSRASCAPRAST